MMDGQYVSEASFVYNQPRIGLRMAIGAQPGACCG
jgi:hypothetical protein